MKRLLVDTATQSLIVILSDEDTVIDHQFEIVIRDHASKLMPSIDQLLQRNHTDIKEIEEIIVSVGPGSYTGVRISVTVAKTLAYALNIPIKKISSLKIISASLMNRKYIVPLIDARRGNVFSALYEVKDNQLCEILEEKLYPFNDLVNIIKDKIKEDIYFVGTDSEKFRLDDKNFHFISLKHYFDPNMVMKLKFQKVDDVHSLIPDYMRLAEAEMNLK